MKTDTKTKPAFEFTPIERLQVSANDLIYALEGLIEDGEVDCTASDDEPCGIETGEIEDTLCCSACNAVGCLRLKIRNAKKALEASGTTYQP